MILLGGSFMDTKISERKIEMLMMIQAERREREGGGK
jgi:hypothetical protein